MHTILTKCAVLNDWYTNWRRCDILSTENFLSSFYFNLTIQLTVALSCLLYIITRGGGRVNHTPTADHETVEGKNF